MNNEEIDKIFIEKREYDELNEQNKLDENQAKNYESQEDKIFKEKP